MLRYDPGYVTDPTIVAVGRLDAVSDHAVFRTLEEAEHSRSSLNMSLNGTWKFFYAERPAQKPEGFALPDYDCSGWDDIQVPGHIELQGYGRPQYTNVQYPWDGREAPRPPRLPERHNPVGCYVREFALPPAWRDERVVVTFHGVESAFFLWVNGQFMGYAEDSFTPSGFDITRALKPGENRLAVEVRKFSTGSYLEDQDFWRFFGIFRDVVLSARPRLHVRDLFVRTILADDFGSAQLHTDVLLDLERGQSTLTQELLDARGAVVDRTVQPALADTRIARAIDKPLLWSAEKPNLYTLRLILRDETGCVAEVAQARVGFRRFEIREGVMRINGRRILFRGVNRHEFSCDYGRALSAEEMVYDVMTLKRHNINAVRTSHYPNQSLWYKLCDEYGLYLIDEANLETHGTWQKGGREDAAEALPGDHPAWAEAVLDRARSMLERDKNHPSVLIWSCGNESFGGRNIWNMSEFFRRRDPTRPVHYEGVFHDRRYNATSDIESQMYTSAGDVAAYLLEHKDKPFILCEYAHAMGNSLGAVDEYLALEERFEQYQGGFIWDMVDQGIRHVLPDGTPRMMYGGDFGDRPTDRNFCADGLLFADRTPSPKLMEAAYLYQPIRMTPDCGGVAIYNTMLFTNAQEYDLTWRLLRDGVPIRSGRLPAPDVACGQRGYAALALGDMREPGEYLLDCALSLREDMPWASRGEELMCAQKCIRKVPDEPKPAQAADYQISLGVMNAGVWRDGYEAMCSYSEGGLVLLSGADGRSLIETAPQLSLYRAPTDNDLGCGYRAKQALWRAASQCARGRWLGTDTPQGLLRVRYAYDLPILPGATVAVQYLFLSAGRVKVTMTFAGVKDQPDMAAFGLSLRLNARLERVRYYGMGPHENYSDRCAGARLGIHAYLARHNMTPYSSPQECGNRCGVRWLCVTDEAGAGVRVEMDEAPLSISVLPWSAAQICEARHQDELPNPRYTYLDIASARMGVGGDHSWGAREHPQYRLPSDIPRSLSFMLMTYSEGK